MNYRILVISVLLVLSSACSSDTETGPSGSPATNLRFTDSTDASGVQFRHEAHYSKEKWMPESLAAGVAVADFNADGAPDIFFTNSGKYGSETRQDDSKDKLFINDGKGNFLDKSAEWSVEGRGYGQGVAVGDFDSDGLPDVFLTNVEGDNRLLRNTGAKFEDVTESAGISSDGKWASSAGFGDFDNDGDLDIYVVRYLVYSKETHQRNFRNKMPANSVPTLYPGLSDQIWRNDGNGKFTDISEASGISKLVQKGLALAIGDIDKDGDADIYVANDTNPNQLWLNDGKGVFTDTARLSGCAYGEVGNEEGSMGADFSDFDENGLLDIVVTNYQEETSALYTQSSKMLFRDVSDAVGIGLTARARLSFGVEFFDADNDGDEDLLVANGHIDDTIENHSQSTKFAQQNSLYENTGDGKFVDVSESAGNALKSISVSRGLAIADFDNDGDLDFVVANNNGQAQLAFNETAEKGNFVGLMLEGEKSNRSAIGTRLVATIGDKKIERQVMGAQSYMSVSDFRVLFGLGSAKQIDSLEIYWPGSEMQKVEKIAAGKYYRIKEGASPEELKFGK